MGRFSQTFQKEIIKFGNLFWSRKNKQLKSHFFEDRNTLTSKPEKDNMGIRVEGGLQINILHEHTDKNLQQNTRKLNQEMREKLIHQVQMVIQKMLDLNI